MKIKNKETINILIDILIILCNIWIIIALQCNLWDCDAGEWSKGWKFFKYFTNNGNLILAFSSIVSLIYYALKKEKDAFVTSLRVVAATCTTIIFIVVYCALSTVYGIDLCFKLPEYLFEHTILPILSFLQVFVFDRKVALNKKNCLYSMIPVGVYTLTWIIVLLILNLPKEVELDMSVVPYFFLAIHAQPVYITVIYFVLSLIISSLIGFSIISINNKIKKRSDNKMACV